MDREIDNIIANYFSSEISGEDEKKLIDWLNESPANVNHFDSLKKFWNTSFDYPGIVNMNDQKDHLWEKLHGKESHHKTKPVNSYTFKQLFPRVAAAIFVVLGLGYLISVSINKDIQEENAIKWVERINPLGQKSKIQLPDGSTVWLNAGSKLSYHNDFNIHSRKLLLEGEAYFEVVKNPNLPFEVHTDELVITAIGTSFNVQAFSGNAEKIALNMGKVKVGCHDESTNCMPKFLTPGEMAHFNPSMGVIELSQFDGEDPFVWKDGKIIFKHARFDEVLTVLARWYNVEFEVVGSLDHEWDYNTIFDNEVLENVLASLKFSEKIDYDLKESPIKIIL